MKVLFDQGTPVPLRNDLIDHQVSTSYELGWATLKNGDLLQEAEVGGFEVFGNYRPKFEIPTEFV